MEPHKRNRKCFAVGDLWFGSRLGPRRPSQCCVVITYSGCGVYFARSKAPQELLPLEVKEWTSCRTTNGFF